MLDKSVRVHYYECMGQTIIKLNCAYCNKVFKKRLTEHKRSERLKRKEYCSQPCQVSHGNKITPRGNVSNLRADNLRDQYTPFRWFINRINQRSKEKDKITDIDNEYLKQLWEEQKGICPITKWPIKLPKSCMGFETNRYHKNASLDRIDPSKWYIRGNVRFISLIANYAKAEWNDSTLIAFCQAVIK